MNRNPPAWAETLLGADPHQRLRLQRCALACLLMLYSAAGLAYLAAAGMADWTPVRWWTLVSLGGMALFLGLIRSGANLRFADPSLTLAQILFALACAAAAYALAGVARGAVLPIVIVILMFGLYSLRPAQVRLASLSGLALFAGVMAWKAWSDPAVYRPAVEFAHFLVVAIMLPAASLLASQLSQLRDRLREQKAELVQALGRIQELASRDELTGLPNRRHMQALVEQEHDRCRHAGRSYCVALLDIDRFKQINDSHGHPAGDQVLRLFAREAQACIRAGDVLARWGGEEFLLMLPDTRATLARLGVERLRTRVEGLHLELGAQRIVFTLSAGVAESRPGESVADTIARADRALYRAKQQGRNCVVPD